MRNERGAALLTVILMTGTLAVLAVAMTEILTVALARAGASEARDQAYWAMHGLEDAALGYLRDQGEVLDSPTGVLFGQPVVIPFEGGAATLTFTDRSNCFNINDLLQEADGELTPDEGAAERFAGLVRELGAGQTAGQQLAARIADFADTNDQPQAGSVDDFDYQRREVPYRSARVLLASVTELRAIAGFSPDVYRALLPHLCALPTDGTGTLNVNTLSIEDAPLLAAAMGEAVTLRAAESLITERPPTGYEDVQAFLDQPLLAGREVPQDLSTMISAAPTVIGLEIVLENQTGRLRQTSEIYREGEGFRVIERRRGERLP
ncbi:type II secretion system minor pseudopilin GspK [Parvularcula maris]|uniref:Type II secretion system protein K n=1 Tax=Parvularcula maris TaxID=2965077 RepID=A0A9X2L8J6_9PROT|nr:type II secretion system minor pseudopilin GspK [Parvularcula maris]MCQ8185061.1 type II secretion system minor pseudopilin GspK [Parvularcula maris]